MRNWLLGFTFDFADQCFKAFSELFVEYFRETIYYRNDTITVITFTNKDTFVINVFYSKQYQS